MREPRRDVHVRAVPDHDGAEVRDRRRDDELEHLLGSREVERYPGGDALLRVAVGRDELRLAGGIAVVDTRAVQQRVRLPAGLRPLDAEPVRHATDVGAAGERDEPGRYALSGVG